MQPESSQKQNANPQGHGRPPPHPNHTNNRDAQEPPPNNNHRNEYQDNARPPPRCNNPDDKEIFGKLKFTPKFKEKQLYKNEYHLIIKTSLPCPSSRAQAQVYHAIIVISIKTMYLLNGVS
jgi:hypothetical protein